MLIKQTIRRYILENFLFTDDESALQDGDSFLAAGMIDSTGVLEITLFIEETFGLKVKDDEMLPENLDSVDNLVAFIQRKQVVAA
ncbi:MAG TPA: acyl carrier protein [Candidatus Competibacter sp.]|nr:acyl carrier protein [Candidatus Competibacter sp.]